MPGWTDDQGDIETPDLPIAWQCKNHKDIATALREGVEGARIQAQNAGKPYGVTVVKRRLKTADEVLCSSATGGFFAVGRQCK